MKTLGQFQFPETAEEAKKWVEFKHLYALHQFVLCVAHTRIEGAWCAYCCAVMGMNHRVEMQWILDHGDKLSEVVARAMFDLFEGVPYAD